jgi:hypothetical protein
VEPTGMEAPAEMGYEDLALVVFVLVIPKPHPQASQVSGKIYAQRIPKTKKKRGAAEL